MTCLTHLAAKSSPKIAEVINMHIENPSCSHLLPKIASKFEFQKNQIDQILDVLSKKVNLTEECQRYLIKTLFISFQKQDSSKNIIIKKFHILQTFFQFET